MKATIESTDRVVTMRDGERGAPGAATTRARVWEGVTESGVQFVAYIALVQVKSDTDNSAFERDLQEHKRPSAETIRAIDARFIL